jgi:hypothetical protein
MCRTAGTSCAWACRIPGGPVVVATVPTCTCYQARCNGTSRKLHLRADREGAGRCRGAERPQGKPVRLVSSMSRSGLGAVATIAIVFAGSLDTGQHDDDVVTLTRWTSE